MNQVAPVRTVGVEQCVEETLSRVGKHVVLGLPLAIGKSNTLANAFVARALKDPEIKLTLVTALSLRKPRWRTPLDRRLIEPLADRIFGDYPELEYVRLLERNALPDNIQVLEFYLEPGAWLHNHTMQQHYLSTNYTHVVRDVLKRGLNVVAQLVARAPSDEAPPSVLSLAANPDLTADLLPQIAGMRAAGRPFVLIGQVHRELPFMYGDALVTADTFDYLLEDPGTPLFCPPNTPVPLDAHAIALNVSTLVRDAGTLQLGIGELGDAIVYALRLRHLEPAQYRAAIESIGILGRHRRLIETEGGTAPFERGLYGCTEMLADGFLDLYRAGILKRLVYPCARIQRLLDEGRIDERVGLRTLDALYASGMQRMSYADFHELRDIGIFREDVEYERGVLIAPDGTQIVVNLKDPEQRSLIAQTCLGEHLRNGVLVDSAFFFGPKGFYSALRELPAAQRRLFAMRGISFVNELYGHEWELKLAQRRHARFINTTMMVTGLGAAVSDALEDGRVVSGVGGQYNFVAMAHALPEARSILCLRATRSAHGTLSSNILWSYGHTTIPRHLRDIVVTEYGIADLRSKTDKEVVEALIAVMDARFQEAFVRDAQRAGKLDRSYRIPDLARENHPEKLRERFAPWRARGLFPELPFGSEMTAEEIVLARALRKLEADMSSWRGRIGTLTRALTDSGNAPKLRPYLQRMKLDSPSSVREHLYKRLLAVALKESTAR